MVELLVTYIRENYVERVGNQLIEAILLLNEVRSDLDIRSYYEFIPDVNTSEVESVDPGVLRNFVRSELTRTLSQYGVMVADGITLEQLLLCLTTIESIDDPDRQDDFRAIVESDQDTVECFCELLSENSVHPSGFYYDIIVSVEERIINHMSLTLGISANVPVDSLVLSDVLLKARTVRWKPGVIEHYYYNGMKSGLSVDFYLLVYNGATSSRITAGELLAMVILSQEGTTDIKEITMAVFNAIADTLTASARERLKDELEIQLTLI